MSELTLHCISFTCKFSVQMGLVKVKGLTGQEMTGIIDDTLACLVSDKFTTSLVTLCV